MKKTGGRKSCWTVPLKGLTHFSLWSKIHAKFRFEAMYTFATILALFSFFFFASVYLFSLIFQTIRGLNMYCFRFCALIFVSLQVKRKFVWHPIPGIPASWPGCFGTWRTRWCGLAGLSKEIIKKLKESFINKKYKKTFISQPHQDIVFAG